MDAAWVVMDDSLKFQDADEGDDYSFQSTQQNKAVPITPTDDKEQLVESTKNARHKWEDIDEDYEEEDEEEEEWEDVRGFEDFSVSKVSQKGFQPLERALEQKYSKNVHLEDMHGQVKVGHLPSSFSGVLKENEKKAYAQMYVQYRRNDS